MKNITRIPLYTFFIAMFMLLASPFAYAGGTKTLEVKTSAICGECKERIELAAFSVPGVKTAVLDMKTKTLKVKYNSEKTTEADILTAVSKAGYDAGDVKADPEAFKVLPTCCQVDMGY